MSQLLRRTVAENIKALRIQAGMTQAELARKAHLTDVYISRIERQAKNITLDSIDQIAKALNAPLSKLIVDSEQRFPSPSKETAKSIKHTIKILEAYLEGVEEKK